MEPQQLFELDDAVPQPSDAVHLAQGFRLLSREHHIHTASWVDYPDNDKLGFKGFLSAAEAVTDQQKRLYNLCWLTTIGVWPPPFEFHRQPLIPKCTLPVRFQDMNLQLIHPRNICGNHRSRTSRDDDTKAWRVPRGDIACQHDSHELSPVSGTMEPVHAISLSVRDLQRRVGTLEEANRKQAADQHSLRQTVKELEATVERLMVLIEQGN
uniref:Uncharacterized protein n=1 Tax=Sphaerodactylus townsendi TaxID=933632 RepID=A0ACB8GE86_9SAUR